jgi:hypothetical protein
MGDRGADLFPLFQACHLTRTSFLARATQNRRVLVRGKAIGYSALPGLFLAQPGQPPV